MEDKRKQIIIVDDSLTNLNMARNALAPKYDVFTVASGKKLFRILEKLTPDLILLDIEMPEMNGYEVIAHLKNSIATAHIPVVFVTAVIDPESEIKGLSLGAIDYITKPFSRDLLLKRVEVHLLAQLQKEKLHKYSTGLEELVDEKRRTIFELQNAILKTVAELVESRDCVTGGHIERTQAYLKILVHALMEKGIYAEELSSWDIDLFVMSSQLHDVGKISIKDSILMKPERLTSDEFDAMKWHANFGMNIIMKIEESTRENAFLKHARIMAGSHHEKWDGTGYFLGLKGENIPLQGRLMAIVDVYDALTTDRPYKKALPHKEAIKIIEQEIGSHFDPLIGKTFIEHEKEFEHSASLSSQDLFNTSMEGKEDIGNSVASAVASIVDARGDEDAGHAEKMQNCLKVFIEALLVHDVYTDEVSAWDMEIFMLSAQLHDVGKIAVNDRLLGKTGRLTGDEFEKVKGHANFGVEVINQIKESVNSRDLLCHAEALVGSHHERWDGSGYPLGLKGEAIPLQGRLMAIVDVYGALTCDRPHRKRMSHDDAVNSIKSRRGTHFDPGLVDVFVKHEEAFHKAICR